MKILTLNTWQDKGPWQQRWEVILRGIRQMHPTLVAFQEIFDHFWALEIQKKTGFSTLLFPKEHAGLVIGSQYPVRSWGVETLSASPLEEYGRYALWAELKIGRRKLFFINTHLSWKLEDGASRKNQLGEILKMIQKKAGNRESIVVGDLNAPPDSPEIRWFIKAGKFLDLFSKINPGKSGFTWDNNNDYAANCNHKMPDRRIDQILLRGSGSFLADFEACKLVYTKPAPNGIWASDHFGVCASFK